MEAHCNPKAMTTLDYNVAFLPPRQSVRSSCPFGRKIWSSWLNGSSLSHFTRAELPLEEVDRQPQVLFIGLHAVHGNDFIPTEPPARGTGGHSFLHMGKRKKSVESPMRRGKKRPNGQGGSRESTLTT